MTPSASSPPNTRRPRPNPGLYFRTLDHLGSTRLVTDDASTPNVVSRRDFLPFGEHIPADATFNRQGLAGYNAGSAFAQQFTEKERDNESGLDYFLARYYSAKLGRFTGVDPENAGASLPSPQLWNAYSYVGNRPYVAIDGDGRDPLMLFADAHAQMIAEGGDTKRRALENLERTNNAVIAGALLAAPGPEDAVLGVFLATKSGRAAGAIVSQAATRVARRVLGPKALKLIKVNANDLSADALADRLGGKSSVKIEGFGNKEFDAVSDEFIAETTDSLVALTKPKNFLATQSGGRSTRH